MMHVLCVTCLLLCVSVHTVQSENENKFTQATLTSPTYTRLSDREHVASQTTISNPSVRGNEGSSGSRTTAIPIQTHTEWSNVIFYCNNDGKVMWSKGVTEGRREIITAQRGETPKKHLPDHRYMTLSDLSLYIRNVSVSDSGIYYCNAVPFVNLIITPVEENLRTITQTPTTNTSVNGSEPEATQTSSSNSSVQKRKGPSVVTTTQNVSKTTKTTPTSSTRANHSENRSTQITSFNSTGQESEGNSSTLAVVMVSVLGGVTAVGVFGALLLWKCFFQKKTVKDKKADHIYESMTDVTQTAQENQYEAIYILAGDPTILNLKKKTPPDASSPSETRPLENLVEPVYSLIEL